MRYLQYAHIVNLVLLAIFCLLAAKPIFWIAWAIYCCVFLVTFSHHIRWMRLVIVPPLLICLTAAPIIAYNVFLFAAKDRLYLNSPATIFVVLVFALLTLLPSALVLSLYWFNRKRIFKAI